jgi:ribosome-associated protein
MNNNSQDALSLTDDIIKGIFEKQGEKLVKIDMRNLENPVCDFFLISHGNSATQVEAIVDSVVMTVKKSSGELPHHKEGVENCHWVLIDYGDVVVHIFQEEFRDFYNLEDLWADAELEIVEDKL